MAPRVHLVSFSERVHNTPTKFNRLSRHCADNITRELLIMPPLSCDWRRPMLRIRQEYSGVSETCQDHVLAADARAERKLRNAYRCILRELRSVNTILMLVGSDNGLHRSVAGVEILRGWLEERGIDVRAEHVNRVELPGDSEDMLIAVESAPVRLAIEPAPVVRLAVQPVASVRLAIEPAPPTQLAIEPVLRPALARTARASPRPLRATLRPARAAIEAAPTASASTTSATIAPADSAPSRKTPSEKKPLPDKKKPSGKATRS